MKTKHYLIGLIIVMANVSVFAQNDSNMTNLSCIPTPNLTVNYLKLSLINANYVENGIRGELYVDKSNNQLFIVKNIEKNQNITWQGTHQITYTYASNGNLCTKVTCSGVPNDCKGEIRIDDNGKIIGGKITIIH